MCIPRAKSTFDTTKSITRKGINSINPILKAADSWPITKAAISVKTRGVFSGLSLSFSSMLSSLLLSSFLEVVVADLVRRLLASSGGGDRLFSSLAADFGWGYFPFAIGLILFVDSSGSRRRSVRATFVLRLRL